MELTIVTNDLERQERERVIDAYLRYSDGKMSRESWLQHSRRQWLMYTGHHSHPYNVIDNRDGKCWSEDFETLDGALQYVCDGSPRLLLGCVPHRDRHRRVDGVTAHGTDDLETRRPTTDTPNNKTAKG